MQFTRIQADRSGCELLWEYMDPNNDIQGCFTADQMAEWFNHGFFNMNLPIRCHRDTFFVPLENWFRQGHSAFLHELPPQWKKVKDSKRKSITVKKTQAKLDKV